MTNAGAAHAADHEPTWDDLIYFSADTNLDLKADRYLGMVDAPGRPGRRRQLHRHDPGPGADRT